MPPVTGVFTARDAAAPFAAKPAQLLRSSSCVPIGANRAILADCPSDLSRWVQAVTSRFSAPLKELNAEALALSLLAAIA
jgi:hypothetical protein